MQAGIDQKAGNKSVENKTRLKRDQGKLKSNAQTLIDETQVYTEKGALKRQREEVESKTWHTRRGNVKQEITKLKLSTMTHFVEGKTSLDIVLTSLHGCMLRTGASKVSHKEACNPIRLVCEDAFTAPMLADSTVWWSSCCFAWT